MAKILSIAPYKYLKPENGGHWGIYFTDTTLTHNNELINLGVKANDNFKTAYKQINNIGNSKLRYIPFIQYQTILKVAKSINPTHILCHHHYLFPAAYLVAKKLNIPIYIRSHNIETERFRSTGKWWWKLMFAFEKYAYQNANINFFISEEDAEYANKTFKLNSNKIVIFPFVTPHYQIPTSNKTKSIIAKELHLDESKEWLIFMGLLNYQPNEEAVDIIVNEILPRLQKSKAAGSFEILICGKNLNHQLIQKIKQSNNIHYLGFVDDLESLLFHSHVMLNPVLNGGGIKTKMIEALAWNNFVVSTKFGAYGVNPKYCGNKLLLASNNNWDEFTLKVVDCINKPKSNIPQEFFENYSDKPVANRIQKYFN